MYPELQYYLMSVIPDSQAQRLITALEGLKLVKGDTVDILVDNYLSEIDNQDNSNNINLLYDLLLQEHITQLKLFGLFVDEEQVSHDKLHVLSLLLTTLASIQDYGDPEALLLLTEIHEDPYQLLNELVKTVTQTDEYLEYENLIIKMNESFISRLGDVLETLVLNQDVEETTPDIQLHPLLVRMIQEKDNLDLINQLSDVTLGQQLLTNPGTLSLNSLLRLHGNRLADDRTAEWLWVLLLVTSSDGKLPLQLFEKWGNHFLEESDQVTMRRKVEDLYHRLTQTLHVG